VPLEGVIMCPEAFESSVKDWIPPTLNTAALERIDSRKRAALGFVGENIRRFNESVRTGAISISGYSNETLIKQWFDALAKDFAEAEATEFLSVTGVSGADLWQDKFCEKVYFEIANLRFISIHHMNTVSGQPKELVTYERSARRGPRPSSAAATRRAAASSTPQCA
jgi:hypothetical protein